ncbi:MAG: hypothetical protein AAF805_10320 [Planctomycetota bacterium]
MKYTGLAAAALAAALLLTPADAEAGRFRRARRAVYRPVVVASPVVVAPRRVYRAPVYGFGGVRVVTPRVGVFVGF